jgi:hypothetical protein
MARRLKLTPGDKRGKAWSGSVMVETIENRVSYTSRTSASPEQRGMKEVRFDVPQGLFPYRAVLLGRRLKTAIWLCLTPTPVAVLRSRLGVMFERPYDEEMEYMVAWLVEEK